MFIEEAVNLNGLEGVRIIINKKKNEVLGVWAAEKVFSR